MLLAHHSRGAKYFHCTQNVKTLKLCTKFNKTIFQYFFSDMTHTVAFPRWPLFVQVKRNNLTCHSWKLDIVENLTPLDLSMTFWWYISLTISVTYRKLFFFYSYHLTCNLIYMKGYFEYFADLTPWDPYREGGNSPKNLSKYFLNTGTVTNLILSKVALEYFFHYSLQFVKWKNLNLIQFYRNKAQIVYVNI